MQSAFCFFVTLCIAGASVAWPYGAFPRDPIFDRGWGMRIYSPAFQENGYIPDKYTCDGDNVSPPLHISGVSSRTLTLVLIMEDPDALNGDWVHWTVWNMAPATRVISENSVPDGSVEGDTDFEMPAWLGPCPRWGVHRYLFRLYALDIRLDLPIRADKVELEKAIKGHIVDESLLVGLYGRDPGRASTDSWIRRKSTN